METIHNKHFRHCDEWSECDHEEAIHNNTTRKHRLPRCARYARLFAMTKFGQHGFSLVELSVVLVIAGIAIAGIMSGTHLLQAAKLDKIISEFTGYVTATNNFKDKYKAWPGDMPNATSFWGAATANGNGDDRILVDLTERIRAWQQLSLSGMIAGAYTGTDAGTPDFQIDVNVPGSTLKNAYYYLFTHHTAPGLFGTTGTVLQLGANRSNTQPTGAALLPSDSYLIDVKMDDGAPTTGNVYFVRGDEYYDTAGRCVTANLAAASATAILTDTIASCRIWYWLDKL